MEDATRQELICKGWRERGRRRIVHGEHLVATRGRGNDGRGRVIMLLLQKQTEREKRRSDKSFTCTNNERTNI